MEKQIPKGIKDIVGPEEMLRMSHIITGIGFKTIDIRSLVNSALK